MKCPYCGKVLYEPSEYFAVCTNEACAYHNFQYPQEIWRDLIAGERAQDALNKISEIKEVVEGCCIEIQQNLLPAPPLTSDEKRINAEISAIDKYMSNIDEIITAITKQEE